MSLARRIGLGLVAPVLAFAIAAIVTSLVLALTGSEPRVFWEVLLDRPANRSIVNILNYAAILYLSGVAAAICFRMNLFNIGVEGQYRVGAFVAAVFAGWAVLPGYLNTIVAILLGMLAGALWAGIAAILRVTRGVSEVIATIMLNAIAGILVGYLMRKVGVATGVSRATEPVPEESRVGGISLFADSTQALYGLSLLAVVVGIGYAVILNRTVFGFNLRAAGRSQSAATASGVNAKKMIVVTMLISGAVAALIGMPSVFGQTYNYGSSFEGGIGFTGIAVALLGRNHPTGIAAGALIFAYLRERATLLNIMGGISPDIVSVAQGTIVISVVIAYAVMARYRARLEQRSAATARIDEEVAA